jgi:DNA-binding transcriptional ArsR family regulator
VLLTSTGAFLEVRDGVTEVVEGLVKRYGSVEAAQKELDKAQRTLTRDLRKYERRGVTARNRFEREVRKTRTRLERALRTNTRRVEREVAAFRKDLEKNASTVTDRVGAQIKATGEQVKTLV